MPTLPPNKASFSSETVTSFHDTFEVAPIVVEENINKGPTPEEAQARAAEYEALMKAQAERHRLEQIELSKPD
jgi:hypothetical protein